MIHRTLACTTLGTLRRALHGTLVVPGDADYESTRKVWNGAINKFPACIVRCVDLNDVVHAVLFAREQQLLVAVRGGGHSIAGHSVCDGGIVIDLSRLKGIKVDPLKQKVQAQAGLTLGEFVHGTQVFGLATTTGTVAGTGLAGLTLGGGLGWFMGKYGLTIDNLLSVKMVAADGQVLKSSTTQHPDLFWAVRGGGGNFGIVTSFEFRLHPVGPVLAGKVVYPITRAREVLRFYREYTAQAPAELTAYATLLTTPDGLPAVAINVCYCGTLEEGERLVEPIRGLGSSLVDLIRPRSYLKLISQADAGAPHGRHYYQRARTLKSLTDGAIEILAEHGARQTSPDSIMLIQHIHGAACRVDPTETAFPLREESYVVSILAGWKRDEGDQGEQHVAWVHTVWEGLQQFACKGVYCNFLGEEGTERVRAAYGVNFERLVALKNSYDPTNFFRLNQNIKPTIGNR
jgi:FAD/FMN-containing dehydrogenase